MSTLKRYKEFEKNLYTRGAHAAGETGRSLSDKLRRFFRSGRQKITIMMVPHTEQKVVNFQISRFALGGIACIFVALLGVFGFFAFRFGNTSIQLGSRSQDLKTTQDSLDSMRDETSRLLKAASKFRTTLDDTLGSVKLDEGSDSGAQAKTGDLSNFFQMQEKDRGSIPEISELKQLTDFLEQNSDKIKQLGALYGSSDMMRSIPTLWPIKSGKGEISMYFGQNKNPFNHQWYLHKGLDIVTFGTGDPICASADGEVVEAGYSSDFGNNVVIQHQFGFFTRYAHMQSFRVQKGQKVQQGQVIGYLGATGLVTGPHLHFEIHLGTSVVDPLKYMNRPKPQAIVAAGNF